MAEVKWIKITTNIFDDEKIKIIDSMPDADAIIVIWFKLLAQAGKVNQGGALFLNEKIAYTDEMLATIFNRKLSTIRLALTTFENLGMVESGNYIQVVNWEKHQNVEGMEKLKLDNAERQQRYYYKNKLKKLGYEEKDLPNDVEKLKAMYEPNVSLTLSHDIDIEEDIEEEIDKDIKNKNIKESVVYFENKELNELFLDFLKLRKQLKAVNSERAITTLINKLNDFDDDTKIEMLNDSITNSWKGVFPKKNTKKPLKEMNDRW